MKPVAIHNWMLAEQPADGDVRAVHNARTVEALWTVLKRVLDRTVAHHSLSLYLNYLGSDECFRVLHDQHLSGSVVPWQERRRLSPAPEFLRRHPGIKTYRLRQLLPDMRTLRRSDYFTRVMQVEGWDTLLGLGFWEGDCLVALLVLRRAPDQGEFEPEDVALLKRWHAHFRDALRRIRQIEAEAALSSSLSRCVESLPIGVMIFDWNLALRFRNGMATRCCVQWCHGAEGSRGLHVKREFAIPPAVVEALRAARERAVMEPADENHGPVTKSLVEVRIVRSESSSLAQACFLVQLHPSRPAERRPCENAGSVLAELTPCERDVALLAAEGLSNGEVASRLGKSVRTVAAQMGAVLAKTGVASRVHLARLIAVDGR